MGKLYYERSTEGRILVYRLKNKIMEINGALAAFWLLIHPFKFLELFFRSISKIKIYSNII